jgi:hypothetical protein
MCWQGELCENTSAAAARQFCTGQIRRAVGDEPGAEDHVGDIASVISELVTNAVNARCSGTGVTITVHRDHVSLRWTTTPTANHRASVGNPEPRSRAADRRASQADLGCLADCRQESGFGPDVAIPAYLTRHITGASSGFGNLTARAVARAGHTVYAGMRATTGRNAAQVAQLAVRCSLPHPC